MDHFGSMEKGDGQTGWSLMLCSVGVKRQLLSREGGVDHFGPAAMDIW
jgi:hypothetical protein